MNQGKLKTIKLDIDNPVSFKSADFNMRELNLITGLNGTGKSFLLVTSWVLGYIIANVAALKIAKQPIDLLQISQYVIDNSLNCTETNGTIEGIFENCSIKITMEKGKVISCDFIGENIDEIQTSIYMSSYMRTFTTMDLYGKRRLDLLKSTPYQETLEILTKDYKIYDVVFMEQLLLKLPVMVTMQTNENLKSFDFPDELDMLGIDEDGFYVTLSKTDEKKNISRRYGAGHQSLLNIILAQQK